MAQPELISRMAAPQVYARTGIRARNRIAEKAHGLGHTLAGELGAGGFSKFAQEVVPPA